MQCAAPALAAHCALYIPFPVCNPIYSHDRRFVIIILLQYLSTPVELFSVIPEGEFCIQHCDTSISSVGFSTFSGFLDDLIGR